MAKVLKSECSDHSRMSYGSTASRAYFIPANLNLPTFSSDSLHWQWELHASHRPWHKRTSCQRGQQMKHFNTCFTTTEKLTNSVFSPCLPVRAPLRFTSTYSACCSKRRKLCCISKRLEKQGLSDLNVSHKKMKSLFIALVSYESLDETTAEVKSTMWRSTNFVLF